MRLAWLAGWMTALLLTGGGGGCSGEDGAMSGGGAGAPAAGSGGEAGAAGEGGQAGGPPADPIPFRIVTFNAENFFNDKKDDPPPFGSETVASTADYQAKLKGVAEILAKIDADLVMLQEVEGDAVLSDLQKRPELAGRYIDRATFSGNDPRGIDLAALSKVTLTQKVSHKDDQFALEGTGGSEKFRFARDLLELHAQVNGRHMIFLGVHLKAKAEDNPEKRLAEAQRARRVADLRREEDPSAAVVILGDFNDFPGSAPMNAVERAAPDEIYRSTGATLPPSQAWSAYSQSAPGGKALHDDLRTSPWLTERLVAGTVSILHDEELPPSQDNVSDHAPVAATFQIN